MASFDAFRRRTRARSRSVFQSEARVINYRPAGIGIRDGASSGRPAGQSLHVRSSTLEAIKWKVAAKVMIFVNRPSLPLPLSPPPLPGRASRKAETNESDRNFSQLSIFRVPPFPGKMIFLPGRSVDVEPLTRENLSRALTWPCSRQISTSFFCRREEKKRERERDYRFLETSS